jgi:hypothetical protein
MVKQITAKYEPRFSQMSEEGAAKLRKEMESEIDRERKAIMKRHMRIASKFGIIIR